MPPKARFTKQHIAEVAFDLVRKEGWNALTARNLGKHLGSSYCPIFTLFDNMSEVQKAVLKQAKELYADYINDGLKQEVAFIGAGKQFVKFAKDEPQLYQVLFMQADNTTDMEHYLPDTRETYPKVLASLTEQYALTEEKAKEVYLHLAVYTTGMGMLCARKVCLFTDEQIDELLANMFHYLLHTN